MAVSFNIIWSLENVPYLWEFCYLNYIFPRLKTKTFGLMYSII